MKGCVNHGDLKNMKWLKSNECPWNSSTFVGAAKHGRLEILDWLLVNNFPWDKSKFRGLRLKKPVEQWLLNHCMITKYQLITLCIC